MFRAFILSINLLFAVLTAQASDRIGSYEEALRNMETLLKETQSEEQLLRGQLSHYKMTLIRQDAFSEQTFNDTLERIGRAAGKAMQLASVVQTYRSGQVHVPFRNAFGTRATMPEMIFRNHETYANTVMATALSALEDLEKILKRADKLTHQHELALQKHLTAIASDLEFNRDQQLSLTGQQLVQGTTAVLASRILPFAAMAAVLLDEMPLTAMGTVFITALSAWYSAAPGIAGYLESERALRQHQADPAPNSMFDSGFADELYALPNPKVHNTLAFWRGVVSVFGEASDQDEFMTSLRSYANKARCAIELSSRPHQMTESLKHEARSIMFAAPKAPKPELKN